MKPWIAFLAASAAIAGGAQAAEIRVYKQPNFSGESLTVTGEVRDFSSRKFQDQISSIVVRSGRWELCSRPNFGGDCMILERGEYPRLDEKLYHRVESARLVESRAEGPRDRYAGDRPRRHRGEASVIELYSRADFEGRTARIDEDRETLAGTRLDRRVFSAIVTDGSWQVCTQPGFRGYCRVLEPGQYPDLGRMSGQIASVRRIG